MRFYTYRTILGFDKKIVNHNGQNMEVYTNPNNGFFCCIGQDTVIDRTAKIGQDAIICNLVIIGPKVKIGCNSVILEGATIGAESQVGFRAVIGPNVGIPKKCLIGDRARITMTPKYIGERIGWRII